MQGRLIERGGERAGTVYLLKDGVTTLGRSAENDIFLPGRHISRRHAELHWDTGRSQLHDLGSKNGVFVNGRRIAGCQPLADGDLITIPGPPQLTLAFECDEETITAHAATTSAGPIAIDPRTAEVRVRGDVVGLTAKEYSGLSLLSEQSGALVTKEQFAARVWPEFQGAVSDDSIEQIIYRLRRKLEENPGKPRYLLTVRGLGYRLLPS